MKRILKIAGIAFIMMLFAGLRNTASAQPMGEVSYQTFYDELSPYGRWVDYPDYGYVWCPDEGADFRPYSTNGRWVWNDDYDWMWVSDYSWGWAPFHYGRWFYDPIYGWMWVPGYDWSPAWVAWRGGGDYYGWAPIMPGINIGIGFSWGNYNCPVDYWSFAPSRYITSNRIYDYCVSPRQNVTIINNTTIINNNVSYRRNVFVNGPGRRDVERYTNERIRSVRVRDAGAPGRAGFRNNEVNVYRPSVQRNNGERSIAPRRFDNYRGNNNVARRNDNNINRNNAAGDRLQRNNNSNAEGRIAERRDNDGFGRRNAIGERTQRNDNINPDVQRRNENLSQRGGNNNSELRNRRENPAIRQQGTDAGNERNVFSRDNRRGIDRPEARRQLETNDARIRNENRVRNENNNFNRREARTENNNRNLNNEPVRQERRNFDQPRQERRSVEQPRQETRSFERPRQERRSFDQPRQQQQRQSFPEMNRRQEQPQRRVEAPRNNGGNGNDGSRRGGIRRQG